MSRSAPGLRMASWVWIALGTAALLLGGLGSAQYRLALARAPLLHHPSGLVVDGSGHIYCGVASSRIQVYDAEGRILRAWPVESGGGPFRLQLVTDAPPAVVEMAAERTGLLVAYDPQGEIVSRTEDATAFDRFGDLHDRSFITPDGARYAFDGTAVVREAGGIRRVVVSAIPLPLRWFAGALWLLVAVFVAGPIAIFAGLVLRGRIATRRNAATIE